LRRAAIDGDIDYGSLMAGQSVGLVDKVVSVKELIRELRVDAEAGTMDALVDAAEWDARVALQPDLAGNRVGHGRELFGLPQARQALREKNTAIVTEGYMDVIALAQNGVGNAVATLGTATTATHVQKLLRQVDRIVFCFDGTTEPDRATAVVVTPPARARRVDPTKDWFRARGERHAYLPWWGLRKDVKWEGYMQGYSQ
jgi:hypothetical protein